MLFSTDILMLVQFHFTYLLLTRGVTYRVKPDIQWVRGNGHFDLQSWIQMEKLNWIFINTFSKDVQFSRRKKKKTLFVVQQSDLDL